MLKKITDLGRACSLRSITRRTLTLYVLFAASTCLSAEEPVTGKTVELSRQALLTLNGEGTGMMLDAYEPVGTTAPVEPSLPLPAPPSAIQPPEPRLRSGLLINVAIMAAGRKEVTESNKRVSDDGELNLPLIGVVRVQGMTLKELAAHLGTLYSAYLRNPQVEVSFGFDGSPGSISPWGSVTVLGRVKHPGSINIPPTRDLTVSRAIQNAGGLDTSANDDEINISRRKTDGTVKQIQVNIRALGSKGELTQDAILEPGDIVYVPEEFL